MKKKFGMLFLSLFFLSIVNCTKTDPLSFPIELIGTWVTEDPQYEDRYIEISETQLTFGTGAGAPNIFFIDDIKKKDQEEYVEWTFYCSKIQGDSFDIVLLYKSGTNGELLELKNKKQIQWVKLQD